jgi:sortase A
MQPEDQTNRRFTSPPSTAASSSANVNHQQAAANLIRSQIEAIYTKDSSQTINETTQPNKETEPPVTNTSAQVDIDINPYDRTHTPNPLPQVDEWQKYHSAWQNYYQKYYEGYYTHHLRNAQKQIQAQPTSQSYNNSSQVAPESLIRNEVIHELRQKLLAKVQVSAQKVRKSQHFKPILVALIAIFVFLFLQYNRVLIANVKAYISPGVIEPQNIVVDPTAEINVGPEPKLIIPKINIDVPVIYGVGSDQNSQLEAMVNGVVHFSIPGASSLPGQIGNLVIAGHSSNDILDTGDYKFIFAQLDKLTAGDVIYTNYESKRYTYIVTKSEEVSPTDISKLIYETDKPTLTLVTCAPLGTALRRLLVTAEQVSPDPAQLSKPETAITNEGEATKMPGNSPTFLERLFGN